MNGYNKVLLIGNITREIELRYTTSGIPIATTGLAVNKRWKDEQGQEKESVTFVDITAFRGTAETLARYKKKGDPLFVEGELKLDQWEDKQSGQKCRKLSVVVRSMTFIDGGKREQQQKQGKFDEAKKAADDAPTGGYGADAEDSIPF